MVWREVLEVGRQALLLILFDKYLTSFWSLVNCGDFPTDHFFLCMPSGCTGNLPNHLYTCHTGRSLLPVEEKHLVEKGLKRPLHPFNNEGWEGGCFDSPGPLKPLAGCPALVSVVTWPVAFWACSVPYLAPSDR